MRKIRYYSDTWGFEKVLGHIPYEYLSLSTSRFTFPLLYLVNSSVIAKIWLT